MKKFTININLDNSAFDEDRNAEIQSILQDVLTILDHDSLHTNEPRILRDSNGNTVGTVEISDIK